MSVGGCHPQTPARRDGWGRCEEWYKRAFGHACRGQAPFEPPEGGEGIVRGKPPTPPEGELGALRRMVQACLRARLSGASPL